MNRSVRILPTAFALGACLAGCTTPGLPQSESISSQVQSTSTPAVRQTDDAGRALPFETEFPNRWSINNDGSPYEPCTQVSSETLRQFGLVADSAVDVAGSDFQTARGCRWKYGDDDMSFVAQFVGDIIRPAEGLTGHKKLNQAGKTWFPDTFLNGRRVLVSSIGAGACSVYIQSGSAVVVTTVSRFDLEPPPTQALCEVATDFLSATVNQIPR
ncbi:DUF3558 family protein [Gordonia sp. AC31]|uniref:DUF3558 family protein n=1 Tax=Gordonia sp. AC31 TaxID=2962571 RepID=UPI0028811C2E|nr:DUF3558 family protein [Gordonia sp. AC31]MDT0223051.1 DUF3558 family protein [Gordonia sp. AC31]